ncbi:unnamed protein product [Anisakis simplex]|uniref:Uncharacterized protein n=1 Tax=Anisakis simplex TaxID=6269 RepID=A0A0M3K9I3_ANISI|nr:unnamed protein product [Anisakis simplex]
MTLGERRGQMPETGDYEEVGWCNRKELRVKVKAFDLIHCIFELFEVMVGREYSSDRSDLEQMRATQNVILPARSSSSPLSTAASIDAEQLSTDQNTTNNINAATINSTRSPLTDVKGKPFSNVSFPNLKINLISSDHPKISSRLVVTR